MNSPITILFPCYLINPWLREALLSIEESTRGIAVDCLVVANNMNETELEALQILCQEILTIEFIILNAGETDLVGALNFGLKYCKHEYIARFDQDDVMLPKRLKLQRDFLDSHTDHSLVGGGVEIISESGLHISFHNYPHNHSSIETNLLRGNCFAHPAVMFRKSKVLEVGGYSSTFAHAEDFDLFIKLSKISKTANLCETVIKYRQNSNQVSTIYRSDQVVSTRVLILNQHLGLLGLQEILQLPTKHSDLTYWLKEASALGLGLGKVKLNRETRKKLRLGLSQSHFAIARSAGYKKYRKWSIVLKELICSLFWSPLHFFREITCVLKSHQ